MAMAKKLSLSDFPVNVRRQNSKTEIVYLGESPDVVFFSQKNHILGAELKRFIDDEFSNWNESWITTGFEFDIKRLGDIEGIIERPSLVS